MAKLSKTGDGQVSSRVDEALRGIREAIEQRRLLPGEALRLDALSRELNMSVQPIREAIRLLEAEGVVERSTNRGVVVAKVSLEQIIELSCLRTVLEPMMTSLATVRGTTGELQALREAHDELVGLMKADPTADIIVPRTIEWHKQLYAMARSPQLSDFVARLWVAIRVNSAWRNAHAGDTLLEHEAILDAMDARDARAAGWAMRAHLREAVVGHLEGFVGEGDPAVLSAITTYDNLLHQMDLSAAPEVPTEL